MANLIFGCRQGSLPKTAWWFRRFAVLLLAFFSAGKQLSQAGESRGFRVFGSIKNRIALNAAEILLNAA